MKKKNLLNSMLICFMLSLTSCNELTVYEKLNECYKLSYDKIELNILTKTNNQELNSNFVLTNDHFNYEIERLSLLDINGNNNPSYIETLKGDGTYANGKITLNGQNVELPSIEEIKGSLNFKEDNFTNVLATDGSFEGDVINLSNLFNGKEVNGTNGNIKVKYSNEPYKFNSIEIKYDTSLSSVFMSYKF